MSSSDLRRALAVADEHLPRHKVHLDARQYSAARGRTNKHVLPVSA
jgi:hypothetical protein